MLIALVLDTIASQSYLEHRKIYRCEIKAQLTPDGRYVSPDSDWSKFIASFNQLATDKTKLIKTYKPGMYVEDFGEGIGVHFYGLNKNGVVANGYSSNGGFANGKGFGFQKDDSHGFCQTFALMHVKGKDIGLKRAVTFGRPDDPTQVGAWKNYMDEANSVWRENGVMALKFLSSFTQEKSPWGWETIEDVLENLPVVSERCNADVPEFKEEVKRVLAPILSQYGYVTLPGIINLLLEQENLDNYFGIWFDD